MTQNEILLEKLKTRFTEVPAIEVPRKELIELLEKAIGFERILALKPDTLYNIPSLLETIGKMDNS